MSPDRHVPQQSALPGASISIDRNGKFICLCLLIAVLSLAPVKSLPGDDVIPPDPSLRWWKGNIHTHSLWSDGNDFPEMIAEWYRTRGYHFLALSDHNVLSEGVRWMKHKEIVARAGTSFGPRVLPKYLDRFGFHWVQTRGEPDSDDYEVRLKPLHEFRALVEERGRFIMMTGEEITTSVDGNPVHLNATNLKHLIPPLGGSNVRAVMAANLRAAEEQAKKTGREIVVHLNHPNFGYAITAEDLASVLAERFVEVYNGHPAVNHLGDEHHPGTERMWDIANTIRLGQAGAPPLFGVATDDSHDYHHPHGGRSQPGRGWIMVRSRHLTPESIILAIQRGEFYASTGVTLRDVRLDETTQQLRVEIEPEDGVTYQTRFIGTLTGYDSASQPRVDADGNPTQVTREYSAEVGSVLAQVEGTNPVYQLNGRELYVRSVITSSEAADNPSFEGQQEQAWTQPVGWAKWIGRDKPRE